MSQETQLPAPMVPAEVDLRGLEYMPLLGARLFGSNFDLDASDTEFRVGLRLWWAAWNQVPAASLPKEDHRIRQLAGLGENAAKWKKVRARALDGFVECSDGRLYHPVVAEQALIAWEKRAEDREKRENEAERKRRERVERSMMFEQLRGVGITPAWNTGTADLRTLIAEHVTRTGPATVTPVVTPRVTPHVTRTGTAKTGRDGTGHLEVSDEADASSSSAEPTLPGMEGDAKPKRPTIPCPYDAIVDAYHQALPTLPAVQLRDGPTWEKRAKAMRRMWGWVLRSKRADGSRRAETAEQALAWFRTYFAQAAENDFVMGRTGRTGVHANWRADLDYLLSEGGLRQVVEKTQVAA